MSPRFRDVFGAVLLAAVLVAGVVFLVTASMPPPAA
jgi:hypothetical protein